MKRIIFKVTQYRIRNGTRMNTRKCPVAATITAQLNNNHFAIVDTNEIEIFKRSSQSSVLNVTAPRSVVRFVDKFDDAKSVKPFIFRLVLPGSVLKQTA
jgi:hypothetical protein